MTRKSKKEKKASSANILPIEELVAEMTRVAKWLRDSHYDEAALARMDEIDRKVAEATLYEAMWHLNDHSHKYF